MKLDVAGLESAMHNIPGDTPIERGIFSKLFLPVSSFRLSVSYQLFCSLSFALKKHAPLSVLFRY